MFKNMAKAKTQPISQNNYNQRNEGDVRIDNNVKLKSHFSPNDGEYVDYEEVK